MVTLYWKTSLTVHYPKILPTTSMTDLKSCIYSDKQWQQDICDPPGARLNGSDGNGSAKCDLQADDMNYCVDESDL